MLEIVHDLAPGAKLYFANAADGTSLSFEQAVNFLALNTDIVVDDISFPIAPFDGTSAVSTNTATALNTDTNPIRAYFTAVDNFAQDHYSGQYVDSGVDGTSITGESGHLHSFQAVPNITTDNGAFGPSIADPLAVPPNGTVKVFLAWNDPNGASTNDYDLFLLPLNCPNGFSGTLPRPPCTISGAPVGSSTDSQTGTQNPTEMAVYQNPTSSPVALAIVIQNVNNQAAAKTFDMFILGTLGDGASPDHNFNTLSGSVPAEGDAGGSPVSVVSVGAIDQTQCTAQGNCIGSVEPYSSQGPTEATPQAAARTKPDVTATDDVSVTGAGGFGMNGPNGSSTGGCAIGETPCYFAGSSAAAPHVAAIAALTLQAAPCLLSSSSLNKPATARANLRNFITGTALPLPGISQTVPNNVEGFGLVNALAAITATLPTVNAGASQTVNATNATGATVNLSGSAADPDSCPVTVNWTGSCGTASSASASLMCPVGNDTETLTASNGGVSASLPTSTVQITVSDFSLGATQSSASVQPGTSATYTINVGSQFGAFTNPVSLACSGLPSLTSCSFSPPSATPGSGSTTSLLTISTTAPSSVFPMWPQSGPTVPIFSAWLGLLFICLVTAILAKRSQRKLAFKFAFSALLICFASAIVACGSASKGPTNPGTTPGTYTVSVTGSSNQLQHSMNVTLTVQ
ncbi:MAG: S8 family serine peptidase [Candidatus Acidiferrales bacterium]